MAAVLAVFVMVACNSATAPAGNLLAVTDFQSKLAAADGAQLIDVRTPDEFNGGHLKGAVNIDFNADNFEAEIAKADKSKPVFVYCLSGGRSGKAAELMSKQGFKEVYDMKGGMLAWRAASLPEEKAGEQLSATQTGMTDADFKKTVTDSALVLVDFNATWCGPCKKLAPILDELADENKGSIKLVKIDIDENKSLAQSMQIQAIPVVQLYKNGVKVWEQLGLSDKETIAKAIAANR